MGQLAINGGTPVRTEPIGVSWPIYDEREVEAVTEVVRSGVWGGLPDGKVGEFEEEFAALCRAKHAICLTSGTSAIEVALRAVGVGPGDEVIVPPYTFIATASAVVMIGALPVFIDVEPGTFNMDPKQIEAVVTERTRAVVPVHVAGRPADMDGVMEAAGRHGLKVVEDACQAHGAEWRGQRVGTIGDAGAFSHQASKHINAGEGGTVVTNDDDVYMGCYSLVNVGRIPGGAWYQHEHLGSNYRMTSFQAAILRVQLSRWEEQAARRDENGIYLNSLLQEIDGISTMDVDDRITRQAWHAFKFRYHPDRFGGTSKARFCEAMGAEGIPCGGWYDPLYGTGLFRRFSSYLASKGYYGGRQIDYTAISLPVVENVCANEDVGLSQTMLLGQREEMDDVAEAIAKVHVHCGEL